MVKSRTSSKENTLWKVLELSVFGAFQTDLKGNILYVNKEMQEIYGKKDLLGTKWIKSILPADLGLIKNTLSTADERKKKAFSFEYRLVHPKKGIRHCHVTSRRVFDDVTNETCIIGYIEDVTEEKKKVEYIKLKTEILASLQRIQDRFYLSDNPHHLFGEMLTDLVRITQSEYGFIAEIVPGANRKTFVPELLATYGFEKLKNTKAKKQANEPFADLQLMYKSMIKKKTSFVLNNGDKADRKTKKIHSYLLLPALINGQLAGMIGFANREDGYQANVDFIKPFLTTFANLIAFYRIGNAKRHAEKKQQDLTNHLQTLITSLDDLIFEFDGCYTYKNIWTRDDKALFMPHENLIGKTLPEVFGTISKRFIDPIDEVVKTGKIVEFEYKHIAPGNETWFRGKTILVRKSKDPLETRVVMSVQDITQKLEQQKALKEANERLEHLNYVLDMSQELVNVAGWEFRFTSDMMYYTKQALKIYDMHEDFKTTIDSMSLNFNAEDLQRINSASEKAITQLIPFSLEMEMITMKKNKKWVRVVGAPLIIDNNVLGLRGATIDITEEKEAKDRLERLNFLLDVTQEMGKVAGWEFRFDSPQMIFTKQAYTLYELDDDFIPTTQNMPLFYNERDIEHMHKLTVEAIEDRKPFRIELEMTTQKKNKRWVRIIGTPQIVNDVVVGLRGATIDITEEKEAKDLLERLNFILDVTQDLGKVAGWELLRNSDVLFLTKQAAEIYEFDADFIPTTDAMKRFYTGDVKLFDDAIVKALEKRESSKFEIPLITAKKNKKWVRIIAIPLIVNHEVAGLRGAIIDITEEKEAQLELLKITEKLEGSNKDKDRILQVLAHDMRSPLSSIHTMSAMMIETDGLSEKNREMLQLIQDSSVASYDMVGELINALASYNKDTLECSIHDISCIISRSVKIQSFNAAEKRQTIQSSNSGSVSVFIDAAKIERVINNLISNAIKFSPNGSDIAIGIQINGEVLQVSVSDRGIGIPPELSTMVFDIFTKGKRYGTAGERPFGLGLSICKQIVEAHDGRIWFESLPGEGTTFFFELPINPLPDNTRLTL